MIMGVTTTFAACYGYPVSHPDRSANEAYLRDVISTMGGLRCSSVIMGDLNDHPKTSRILASSHLLGMFRVSSDEPTTLTKDGLLSNRDPLDHCLVNLVARDRGLKIKTDPTLRISDHVPVLVNLPVAQPRFMQVVWPAPVKLGKRVENPPWNADPHDFDEWQLHARAWIEKAHDVEKRGPQEVAYSDFLPQKPQARQVLEAPVPTESCGRTCSVPQGSTAAQINLEKTLGPVAMRVEKPPRVS